LPSGVNGHVPQDAQGQVLDFDHLVQDGPGVDKLAALKIDVDKLGSLFLGRTEANYQTLSSAVKKFFDAELLKLIQNSQAAHQIYVVFAGGDDCFLIGRWNVLFDLARQIRQAFTLFQGQLREKVDTQHEMTLSAGLVVVSPTYPMVRLADEAEAALHAAKTGGRNRVTVFGEVLRWDEFETAQQIAGQLQHLINDKGESRAVLEFVKNSEIGFDRLQQRARNGSLSLPKVWRLKYYLRNVQPQNRDEMENIFREYETALIQAFMRSTTSTNPAVFPVAARWAELLTRSNEFQPQTNEVA
jgi:CRISPR-associated protein Csm1